MWNVLFLISDLCGFLSTLLTENTHFESLPASIQGMGVEGAKRGVTEKVCQLKFKNYMMQSRQSLKNTSPFC